MNMKVNRSWQLLKAGTEHTSFLHGLKPLLLPFLAKQDLTAVRDTFPVQPSMGKLTSTCHLQDFYMPPSCLNCNTTRQSRSLLVVIMLRNMRQADKVGRTAQPGRKKALGNL